MKHLFITLQFIRRQIKITDGSHLYIRTYLIEQTLIIGIALNAKIFLTIIIYIVRG